jgi:alginate O-acetyltransferase complex protein AlgI
MFGNAEAFINSEVTLVFKNNMVFILIAAVASTPLIKKSFALLKKYLGSNTKISSFMDNVFKPVVNTAILILAIIFLVGQTYNPFLYFRF